MEQEFQGPYRRLHRAVMRLAGRLSGPETRWRRRLSPVYGWLLHAVSAGRGLPAEINGQQFRIDPRFRWRLWPDYEAELAGYLSNCVRPGDCCFDVGANVGIYALQMARWNGPHGRVVAFEPNPKSADVLKRHIRMNGLGRRVTTVPLAVGRQPETAALFDTQAGSGLSRLGRANPAIVEPAGATEVRVTTIDDYCRDTGTLPDWIMVDVEGYEFDVLAGAAETIRTKRPALVVELHPHLWPDGDRTREAGARLLEDLGLRAVPLGNTESAWSQGSVRLEYV